MTESNRNCTPGVVAEGETARLTKELVVKYSYNSHAIEGDTLTLREMDMEVPLSDRVIYLVLAEKKGAQVYRWVQVRIMGEIEKLFVGCVSERLGSYLVVQ